MKLEDIKVGQKYFYDLFGSGNFIEKVRVKKILKRGDGQIFIRYSQLFSTTTDVPVDEFLLNLVEEVK